MAIVRPRCLAPLTTMKATAETNEIKNAAPWVKTLTVAEKPKNELGAVVNTTSDPRKTTAFESARTRLPVAESAFVAPVPGTPGGKMLQRANPIVTPAAP